MTDIFQLGRQALASASLFNMTAELWRGGERITAEPLKCKRGMTTYRYTDGDNISIREERNDVIVATSDLQGYTPKPGDRIVTSDGATYSVGAPNGEPVYEWHTRDKSQMRIHTALVREAAKL